MNLDLYLNWKVIKIIFSSTPLYLHGFDVARHPYLRTFCQSGHLIRPRVFNEVAWPDSSNGNKHHRVVSQC